jgi:zinc/manganese transport system permease protein
MVPAAAARFWAREVWSLALTSSAIGSLSGLIGLLASYHAALPSGPAIILTASCIYALSVVWGPRGGILSRSLRLQPA